MTVTGSRSVDSARPARPRVRRPSGVAAGRPAASASRRGGIATRLRWLIALPLVAVLALTGLSLWATVGAVRAADRTQAMVELSDRATTLVTGLEAERVSAVGVLTAASVSAGQVAAFENDVSATNDAVAAYGQRRRTVMAVPAGSATVLARVDAELAGLSALRKQVVDRSTALSSVVFAYRIIVADLLAYSAGVAQAGAPADVADEIRAAAALAQAREDTSLEQVNVLIAAVAGLLTPSAQSQITAAHSGYTSSLETFTGLAPAAWSGWLATALTGPQLITAQRLEDAVTTVPPGRTVRVDTAVWSQAMTARVDALAGVGRRIEATILARIAQVRDGQVRQAMVEAGVVLAVVAGIVWLGWWWGRRLVGRLHRMSTSATSIANVGLPRAVAALQAPDGLAGLDPAEAAQAHSLRDVLPDNGRDEIGQVNAALATLVQSALLLAAQQAADRNAAAQTFVAIARRAAIRAARITSLLDAAERREADPERLDHLFGIDHELTLLTRGNRTLLVIAGRGSVRYRGPEPAPWLQVLTAASQQIEGFTRVEFRGEPLALGVRPECVDDLVHLFAELFDNAARFSSAQVLVDCHALGDRVIVQITDFGHGIPPDMWVPLNARLGSPELARAHMTTAMGLTAVAMLAALLGVRVELRPRPVGEQGTIAEVTVPMSVLTSAPTSTDWPIAGGRPAPTARQPARTDTARGWLDGPTTEMAALSGGNAAARMPGSRGQAWPPSAAVVGPASGAPARAMGRGGAPGRPGGVGLPRRQPMDHLMPELAVGPPRHSLPDSAARDPRQVGAQVAAFVRGTTGGRPPAAYPASSNRRRPL